MKCNTKKINLWQQALRDAITDPNELIQLLELDPSLITPAQKAAKAFPVMLPRGFIQRMKKGDRNDPLLLQVLPIAEELTLHESYSSDPLQEKIFNPVTGLLHKYKGRVLLTLASRCAINCRYCFRKYFPYEDNNPGLEGWEKAMDYIAQDASITEVILSGGDPLIVTDSTLKKVSDKLAQIKQVKRLRIHSRIPVVLPERITPELVEAISHSHFKTVMVIHCNHPNELNSEVQMALNTLAEAGIKLLNQSVLLKGVNDNSATLIQLSEKLFEFGVLPYYLHTLDKVQGTAHFDIQVAIAKQIHADMLKNLPGYLVPKLVCEQPGNPSKLGL